MLPPLIRKLPGRTKKARRKEIGESKKTRKMSKKGIEMSCITFHRRGYNKRKFPIGPTFTPTIGPTFTPATGLSYTPTIGPSSTLVVGSSSTLAAVSSAPIEKKRVDQRIQQKR